jgi:hypothetical protein
MAANPNDPDIIPAIEIYRECRIHDCQPAERIANTVKPQLDKVLACDDLQALFDVCQSIEWSPESRLLARSKLLAALSARADNRTPRPPGITAEKVKTATAGLDVCRYRDAEYYASSLEGYKWRMPVQHRPADFKQPVARVPPLPRRWSSKV